MKYTVKLKISKLIEAQVEKRIVTDTDLASLIGVSVTQVWRAKQGHNSPGTSFIGGVLDAFNAKFEDFFYVEENQNYKKVG